MTKYKVRYVGSDRADIRHGEVYVAEDLKDSDALIGIRDRSGEWYAYPKEWFERIEN